MNEGETVLKYMGVVHKTARSLYRQVARSTSMTYEDLVSAGRWGLLQAIRKVPNEDDPRFLPYLYVRVKGAMLDEVRQWDAQLLYVDDSVLSRFGKPAEEVREISLDRAFRSLPKRWANAIRWIYLEGATLTLVAKRLQVSLPRVCQLRDKAINALRSALKGSEEPLPQRSPPLQGHESIRTAPQEATLREEGSPRGTQRSRPRQHLRAKSVESSRTQRTP